MSGFFSKIFGGKKQNEGSEVETLIQTTLDGLFEIGGFDISFEMESNVDNTDSHHITVELSGDDTDLIKDREGAVIDSIQLFVQRVVQHHLPEDRTKITIDCGGYREESNQALVDLAEKLKGIALEKGKSVYFRALPPKDRKVIHQYLANDERVRSRSIGDGLFKKIKIYPVKNKNEESSYSDNE